MRAFHRARPSATGFTDEGQIIIGQDGRLPAGILLLEDSVPRELGTRPRFLVDRRIRAGAGSWSIHCWDGYAAASPRAR